IKGTRIHISGMAKRLKRNWSEFSLPTFSDLWSLRRISEEKVLTGIIRPLPDWIGRAPKRAACSGLTAYFCTASSIGEVFSPAFTDRETARSANNRTVTLVALRNSFRRRL